ncbi:hypothetical protein V6N13_042894 [Hibiscus sabdariffa]|uniref:Uncharacterized protein n=1 Tax=Hibiscus sabdariffa TaxID=183260 RepID=A0ABR2G3W1_9ROSI
MEGGPSKEAITNSNLYGPWVLVEHRRRRVVPDGRASKVTPKYSSDSRFKELEEVIEPIVDPITLDDASQMSDR